MKRLARVAPEFDRRQLVDLGPSPRPSPAERYAKSGHWANYYILRSVPVPDWMRNHLPPPSGRAHRNGGATHLLNSLPYAECVGGSIGASVPLPLLGVAPLRSATALSDRSIFMKEMIFPHSTMQSTECIAIINFVKKILYCKNNVTHVPVHWSIYLISRPGIVDRPRVRAVRHPP